MYDVDGDQRRPGAAFQRNYDVVRWEGSLTTSASTSMRLVGFLAVGILCGCSAAGTPAAPTEDHHIRTLIGSVSEYHANPKRFETLFVAGAIPDKATRAKLRGMMTKLDRALVDDTGLSATADVLYEVLQTGEILGPVEWKLAKTGDQWKVSVFALPGGSAASP
jgi:hypothetical protein